MQRSDDIRQRQVISRQSILAQKRFPLGLLRCVVGKTFVRHPEARLPSFCGDLRHPGSLGRCRVNEIFVRNGEPHLIGYAL